MAPRVVVTLLLAAALIAGTPAFAPGHPPRAGGAVEIVMVTPAAPDYTTEGDDLTGPLAEAIHRGIPGLRVSRRLSRAAAAYARLLEGPDAPQPPQAAIDFILHWAGCPDATGVSTVLFTTENDPGEAVDAIRRLISGLGDPPPTHVGVARVPHPGEGYRWRWGIVLVTRSYHLKPFPATVLPGRMTPLQVRLAPGLERPRLVLLRPEGGLEEAALAGTGRWSVATVDPGPVAGTLWVEIVARNARGPFIVALFPVTVGGAPPTRWSGDPPPDESGLRDTRRAEELMVRLVNRDRARHGLPTLVADAELAAIARSHSADMARNGFFGHVSPTRGGLGRRLEAAGYTARWWAENVARAGSIFEAEEALMRSPGHRANILAPEPTRVGVGVVRSRDATGPVWVVTQCFARPLEAVRPGEWRAAVVRALSAGGAGAPVPSGALDRIAGEAAAEAARLSLDASAVMGRVADRLRQEGVVYTRLRVLTFRALEPSDIALDGATGAPPGSFGVGTAPVSGGHHTLVVVILLG